MNSEVGSVDPSVTRLAFTTPWIAETVTLEHLLEWLQAVAGQHPERVDQFGFVLGAIHNLTHAPPKHWPAELIVQRVALLSEAFQRFIRDELRWAE